MGICMEEYGNFTCDCDIGWTGDDCSIDCKCNGHSLCENGPGQCDLCLNGTKGPYCNECMDGHYGDPKTIDGELGKTCIPVSYVFIVFALKMVYRLHLIFSIGKEKRFMISYIIEKKCKKIYTTNLYFIFPIIRPVSIIYANLCKKYMINYRILMNFTIILNLLVSLQVVFRASVMATGTAPWGCVTTSRGPATAPATHRTTTATPASTSTTATPGRWGGG